MWLMERLPVEILGAICELVKHTHKPSLRTISQVCTACRRVALRVRFRVVRLQISGRKQLSADVQDILRSPAETLDHMRVLIVEGSMPLHHEDAHEPRSQQYRFRSSYEDEDPTENPLRLQKYEADQRSPSTVYQEDEAWAPLASLIKGTRLSDLFYACPSQLSPCVLDALHRHRNSCRLHLLTFSLRSLPVCDAYERKLATSPCLHSVRSTYYWWSFNQPGDYRHQDGTQDYKEQALMQMAAGLAPNLREVHMARLNARELLPVDGRPYDGPRQVRDVVVEDLSKRDPRNSLRASHLRHLRLTGWHGAAISKVDVQQWDRLGLLSHLRTVQLDALIDQSAVYDLAHCTLPSLTTLSIKSVVSKGDPYLRIDKWIEHTNELVEAVSTFLQSLLPLSSLSVTGGISRRMFEIILESHGRTLRTLRLSSSRAIGDVVLKEPELKQMALCCPMLETVTLVIPRFRGKVPEVAIYEALGTMPRLQDISLTLMVPNYYYVESSCVSENEREENGEEEVMSDSSFDEEDHEIDSGGLRNGDIRHALLNCALDEILARAIFARITAGKQPGSLSLERLQLQVRGGRPYELDTFTLGMWDTVKHLAGSWELVRFPRMQQRNEIMVKDLREMKNSPNDGLDVEERQFRRVWPERYPGSDWRDDWFSAPLQID